MTRRSARSTSTANVRTGADNCRAENLETEACLDDDGAVAAVAALADAGIKTIVVGIPGTEEYESTLNAMADAGGLPADGDTSYYAVAEGRRRRGIDGSRCSRSPRR